MPQRPRSYRKRQQDGDEDEVEDVSESGGKEDHDSEEDSVRFVLVLLRWTDIRDRSATTMM